MFRAWAFTEMGYPYTPPQDTIVSHRVILPNEHYDPETGYQMYKLIFDLYEAADDLGLDIMLNEHHQTATCLNAVVPLPLAILSRTTKRARLLPLGNPLANRSDPVRVAEEMAMCDVISGGRLDVGFVRGIPEELSATNTNPVDMKSRLYEAADLIVKAWTTHDGPFNWEGEHFHHRQVNIWPRPYQQPHPKIWMPTLSAGSAPAAAERGWTVATIFNGIKGCRSIFDSYRSYFAERGLPAPPREQFAYLGFVFVGDTDEEGYEGARKLRFFLQHNKRPDYFLNVPGYLEPKLRAQLFQQQREAARARRSVGDDSAQFVAGDAEKPPVDKLNNAPIEELIEGGFVFAGNPDSVFEQLRDFYYAVGGLGNFLMMVHVGTMSSDLSVRSMERFAREVLPRFREEVYACDRTGPELVVTPGPFAPADRVQTGELWTNAT